MFSETKQRHRVLIVDDTPENIRVLLETLCDEFATLVATSGEHALQMLQLKPQPDIVLLDINMPGMDGYEVCRRILTDESTKAIPVLFVTAKSGDADEQKGLDLGALDYIHKPFNPALIRSRIRNHLELKRYRSHLEQLVDQRTSDLKKALEAAEAASHAKSRFLATMSHELRTPLNSVIGFTDLVHRRECGEINEEQQEYLGYVLENAKHLLSLINTILDLTKLESGKMELDLAMTNIRELVSGSLVIVKERADRDHITISTTIDEKVPVFFRMDERKIKQVLVNLLANAIKFTHEQGMVKLKLELIGGGQSVPGLPLVAPLCREHGLLITVIDSGIGVKPEDRKRIFEPFVQADNSSTRKHEGSGLGLALSKMLVELHGGTIWVADNDTGFGAVFSVILPFVASHKERTNENSDC